MKEASHFVSKLSDIVYYKTVTTSFVMKQMMLGFID